MIFYYYPNLYADNDDLVLAEKPEILTFDQQTRTWKQENGTCYMTDCSTLVPLSNDEEKFECLTGYFIVEVTDPYGKKGRFKLHAANEIVDYCRAPGVVCDDEIEGKALADCGIAKPEMEHSFIPHIVAYGFNEVSETIGTMELELHVNEGEPTGEEEIFHWKVI
ncbi:hypothetical protein I7Z51_002435 [Vibrio parahaemolyticus]|uniref:hypothetical protein n=1 Tax=Vibrio TaxID=662 RepID=UPI001A8C5D94|nr:MULTISPECIES: hypothetical protein [Vibrio]EGQ7973513.1 hypothetical protein [Vibrio parahaemolyticus]MBO0208585.1 hypothetical protein [Vibrio sp. Vb0877]MCR9810952.1 hypothetical protein [Vibrio parahaemolyticus]MDW2323211.1 hypothetical protein [Vibrio sp. 1159]